MTHLLPADIQSLILRHMATGQYASEEEVLRVALEQLANDESADLEASIDDWQNGDEGTPLAEAFARLRRECIQEQSP